MATATNPLVTSPQPIGQTAPLTVVKRTSEQSPPIPHQWVEYVQGLTKKFGVEERGRDWRMHQRYITAEKFFQGDQFGRLRIDGKWERRKRTEGDPRYVHNKLRGHSLAVLSQWVLSRTELTVIPIPEGDSPDDAEGAARIAKVILEHYQRDLLNEKFKQREGMLAQFTGNMYRYTYWDPQAGTSVQRPQYEMQPEQTQGAYACLECGASGSEQDLQQTEGTCPECGSDSVQTEPGETHVLPSITGYDEVQTGDIRCLCIPAYQVTYDRSPFEFGEIEYLRWRSIMRPEKVKEVMPRWKKQTGSERDDDVGLRTERILKRSVGNVEASGGRQSIYGTDTSGADREQTVVDRWWFKPSLYAEYKFPVDVEMASGDVLKAGTRALDYFTKGMYMLLVNGEPLDFRNENLHDHWQHTPTIMVPSRIDGDGMMDDLVELQREMNDVKGLKLANIKYVVGAGMIYRPEFIDRTDIPSKPFEVAPVKPGTPTEMPLENIMSMVPRAPLPAEAYQYDQQLDEEMQFSLKTFSSTMGSPDLAGAEKTLGGMQLMAQGATSQRAPDLALRANGDVEWAAQVLNLFQQNATDEMYIPYYGKSGAQDGDWFKGSQLPNKFVISMRPRSYIPKGEMERRQDFMGLLQAFGGIQGALLVAQSAPELWEEACERFNVTIDLGGNQLEAKVCRMRFEAMKAMMPQVMSQAQQMGSPDMAAQILVSSPDTQVDPEADNHMVCIQWWRKLLHENEGIEARRNPVLFQAIHLQIQNHKQATVMQQQEAGQDQLAAQQPQLEAAQAMQQQQAQMQSSQEGQKQEQEQSQQQQQLALQMAQQLAEQEHEAQMTTQQQAHEASESAADRKVEMAKLAQQKKAKTAK